MAMNLDQTRTITTVLQLVSHLGGPACVHEDFAWAADIPAGKQLLEWLADQIPGDSEHLALGTGPSSTLETVVSPIVLYTEERNAFAGLVDGGADRAQASQAEAQYELPYKLRSRTSAVEADADLLEKHVKRLQHRLSASKKAAKGLKQAIHTLLKQIQDADETIKGQQVRLTDLSVETDRVISRVTSLAAQALQHSGTNGCDPIEAYKDELATVSSSRAAVAAMTKQLYQTLDQGYASLPTTKDLQHDAETVRIKLKTVAKGQGAVQKIVDAAYMEELSKMTKQIEAATRGTEAIARILEAPAPDSVDVTPSLEVDVKAELERAGRLDRLALLRAQEQGLDTLTSYMHQKLVPRLQQTYDTLHAKSTIALETEAIVSALIEELEDVNDAVEGARHPAMSPNSKAHDDEEILEAQIVELLKGLLSSETDRPTVLLNRSDVEAELSALAENFMAARKAEDVWAAGLRFRLGELSKSTAPLLAAAYANSPVNTSPPFAPSSAQVALQEDTQKKAEELMSAAARLQKESELSSRDKRKLGAFVDKWVSD